MKNQYGETKPRLYSFKDIKEFIADSLTDERREVIEIVCDHCGNHLCMAVDFDLEGSFFLCDICYKEMNEQGVVS